MYLIWAYHTSEDGEDPANFPQHSKQGVSDVEYEIVPGNLGTTERPPAPAVTVAPTSGAAAVGGGLGSSLVLAVVLCIMGSHNL